jgi:Ca2+-binding RTX toxin-like protein
MTFLRSAGTLFFAVSLAWAVPAQALITTTLVGSTVTVTSIDEATVTLSCSGGNLNVNGATPVDAGAVPCASITSLLVVGNALDNVLQLAAVTPADFTAIPSVQIQGGDGADTITGSGFADTIHGGSGADVIDPHDNPPGTTDIVFAGDGDDTITWNPGRDDDIFDGEAGTDTAIIVGGGAAETFTVEADPGDPEVVILERTSPAPFFVQVEPATEILRVQGNGGDDVMNASTLPAGLIALELLGGDGNDTLTGSDGADLIDGGIGNDVLDGDDNPVATTDNVLGGDGDDTLVWNPGKDDDVNVGGPGNDTSVINGGGGDEVFRVIPDASGVRFERTNNAPAPFFVQIRETERLQVNAAGGNDSVDASTLTSGLIALEFNGGAGNDSLVGGPDADVLNGGDGNDTLRGGPNPLANVDRMSGDGGDDLLLWNPGESSDLNEGGDGSDTLLVNGAGANERFEIEQLNGRTIVQRTLPSGFVLDNDGIEILQLNTAGGDDVVQTEALPDTVQQLDGGAAASAAGDHLIVRGYAGRTDFSPILVPGAAAIAHSNFESDGTVLGGGSFSAALDGAQEVPPVTTAASGRGSVVLNAREDEISVRLSFANLSSDSTMAHIHGSALPGANAGVIFGLSGAGGSSGEIGPLTFAVTPTQVQQLKDGLWYFNVHSVNHGGGEVRGQIVIDELFTAPVEARQVVPASLSTARGYATIVLAGTQDQATVTMTYAGLVGEGQLGVSTAVRVHSQAARGQIGPVVASFVLPASGSDQDSFIAGPFPMSAGQVSGLRSGRWYIEVESVEFPQGEIRGQFSQSLFFDNFE